MSSPQATLQSALALDESLINGDLDHWIAHNQASCEAFLAWAGPHKELKVCNRQIPQAVRLPKGIRNNLVLQDVQVHGSRRAPDDKIYSNNQKIRTLVARGNTLLSFRRNGTDVTCFPLQGMKKFTGGMGDDDDQADGGDNLTWKKFFTRPSEDANHIVSTSKENGSAAHLSALNIDGELVVVGGSKNSHLILSLEHGEADLKLYPESPWRVAKTIMQAIFDLFKEIGAEKTREFVTLLADWHMTAVFEMMDPEDQHVELLLNKRPIVRFITFTAGWQGENQKENKLCMYPLHSVRVAAAFDVPTIKYDIIPMSAQEEERKEQFEALQTAIRGDFGDEGKVLYFATETDEVIGVLKKKTCWYILLRALREKYKSYGVYLNRKRNGKPTKSTTLEQQKAHIGKQIAKRMREIQSWLGFSDQYRDQWIAVGQAGNEWIAQELVAKRLDPDLLGHMFPVVWDRFVKATGASDRIPYE